MPVRSDFLQVFRGAGLVNDGHYLVFIRNIDIFEVHYVLKVWETVGEHVGIVGEAYVIYKGVADPNSTLHTVECFRASE